MRREQCDVGKYYRLPPEKRINGIIKNYDRYQGIIEDYSQELFDWIAENRAKSRNDAIGDLGVRISNGKAFYSPTETVVFEKTEIESMLKNYRLSPSCKDMDDYDEISRGLLELKLMKWEYKRFCKRLGYLRPCERDKFIRYMRTPYEGHTVYKENGIEYQSYRNMVCRIKKKIFSGFICRLDTYDDMNIYIVGGLSDE